ncbi:hypothetical protein BRC93_02350 [Halobacteriales archaeon QS_5_70_15]|nr:MAG: hypothetical protein BRC93_02350 [Halobacteriales archaeon QS_5_70_15]
MGERSAGISGTRATSKSPSRRCMPAASPCASFAGAGELVVEAVRERDDRPLRHPGEGPESNRETGSVAWPSTTARPGTSTPAATWVPEGRKPNRYPSTAGDGRSGSRS